MGFHQDSSNPGHRTLDTFILWVLNTNLTLIHETKAFVFVLPLRTAERVT